MGRKLVVLEPETDNDFLFEMSNIVGTRVKLEDIDFSFYYSQKLLTCQHGIRVKIAWNRSKLPADHLNELEIHGNYEYNRTNKKEQHNVPAKKLNRAKEFFKKYKILFAAVWENVLEEGLLFSYLSGLIRFQDLLLEFRLKKDKLDLIKNAKDLVELEEIVRKYKLFNMND